jgi:hypothetical protein
MFCKHCGAQTDEAALFCSKCGAKSSEEIRVVPSVPQKAAGGFHRFCLGALAVWTAFWAGMTFSVLGGLSNSVQHNGWAMAGVGLGLVFYGLLWFIPFIVLTVLASATRPSPSVPWPRGSKWATILLSFVVFAWPFELHSDKPSGVKTTISSPSVGGGGTGDSGNPASQNGSWIVSEEKSEMDGSPTVTLIQQGENEIQGWLESKRPSLVIRCQERKMDVYVNTGMQASIEGDLDQHTARIRIDDKPAFKQWWSESTDKNALFAPSPRPLARSLAKGRIMLFEFVPFQASPATTKFDLHGLNELLPKVEAACPVRGKG